MVGLIRFGKYTIALSLLMAAPASHAFAGSNGVKQNVNNNAPILNLPEKGLSATSKTDTGILKKIEDAGYPMFNLSIQLKDQQFVDSYLINLEAADIDVEQLYRKLTNIIEFTYTQNTENALFEITYANEALLGDGVVYDNWAKITGRLQGAEMSTFGDLPDVISVTPANGTTIEFKAFINDKMAYYNDQEVTAYYDVRTATRITTIK